MKEPTSQQMDTVYWFFPSHLSYRCKSHTNCRYKHVKQYKNKWKANFIFTKSSCVINTIGKKKKKASLTPFSLTEVTVVFENTSF